jgi:hypothetical protein
MASLAHFQQRGDLREESPRIVADMVAWVVEVEAPVHIDYVVERVRRYYDLQRAGVHVRTAVEAGVELAIRQGRVERLPRLDGRRGLTDFLGRRGEVRLQPRALDASGAVRPIEKVCDQEIAAGIAEVVRKLFGAPADDVVVATARSFGYARTGGIVESRLRGVVQVMLHAGDLQERLGSLVMRDP